MMKKTSKKLKQRIGRVYKKTIYAFNNPWYDDSVSEDFNELVDHSKL